MTKSVTAQTNEQTGAVAVQSPRSRRPEEVRQRLLDAAQELFAVNGFDGTRVQEVAGRADTTVSLAIYHFGSKLELWKAAITAAARKWQEPVDAILAAEGVTATTKLRQLISVCVRMTDYHRIMMLEGYRPSERMTWLCENFEKRSFDIVGRVIRDAQAEGTVRRITPERLHYAILGLGSVTSVAAAYTYLTGRDPYSEDEQQQTIDFVNRIVFVDG